MILSDFLDRFFSDDFTDLKTFAGKDDDNNYYFKLIIAATVSMIAKTLSKCEILTFQEGIEVKEKNYYMLNVEANKNTSASTFMRKVIQTLLVEGEALIIIEKDQLKLVDSFERRKNPMGENTYRNIKIGDYNLVGVRTESEVLYLEDTTSEISGYVKAINNDYASLIGSSIKGYQNSKARKGTLKIPANLPRKLSEEGALQDYIQETMKDFMDPSKDAVYPEANGFEYTEISQQQGSKTNDSGRETKNFISDMFDFVGIAFGIPPSLLRGNTVDTKDALNNYLAFCIDPLAKLLNDEINRKMYGYERYKNRTYAKIDTGNIKATDLADIAGPIDMLNRNGALTVNDILRKLDKEPLDGEVGNMRFITKNLEILDENVKGGDEK